MAESKPIHFERCIQAEQAFSKIGMNFLSWMHPVVKSEMKSPMNSSEYRRHMYDAHIMKTTDPTISITKYRQFVENGMADVELLGSHLWAEYHTYAFNREGRQVFSVDKNLAQMLMDTDVDVDADSLRMPYSSFYIEVPRGILEIHNKESGTHSVDGIYVVEEPFNWDECREIARTATGLTQSKLILDKGLSPTRSIQLLVIGEDKGKPVPAQERQKMGKYALVADFNWDDAMFFFTVNVGTGKVKQYLDLSVESAYKLYSDNDPHQNLLCVEEIFRFVMNTILYINSKDVDRLDMLPKEYLAEIEKMERLGGGKTKKGQRCLERAKKHTSLHKVVLGSRIDVEEPLEEGRSWRINSRFRVRGFWRTYESERYKEGVRGTTVWIAPFWKGPEMADLVKRQYSVKAIDTK